MQNKLNYVKPQTTVIEVMGESAVCVVSGQFGAPYYEEDEA